MIQRTFWPDPRLRKPKASKTVTCEIKHDERFVSLLELTEKYALASDPQKIFLTSYQENKTGQKIYAQGTGKIYLGSDKQIYGVEVIVTLEEDARVKWTLPSCIQNLQSLKG